MEKIDFSKLWISNSTEDQTYTSHILRWSCENPHLYVYADIHNYCNGYWNFKAELNAINPRVYISMRDCEHVGTLEETKTMIEGLLNSFIERCQK